MGYIMDLRKVLGHRPIIIPGAAVLFVNEKNEILLHERADNHGLIADKLEFFDLESGESTHYIYPHGDEIYVAGVLYLCREYHGELKIQEEEVIQQRFFAEDELPHPMDPMNEAFIRKAFAKLKSRASLPGSSAK